MSRVLKVASVGCFGLMIGALAACEVGPSPGEYVVYRIASAQEQLSEGCFSSGIPANDMYDTTTLRKTGVFLLFAGPDDTFYLDTGSMTLDGLYEGSAPEGDVYTFEANAVDVNYSCSDATGDKTTATSAISVELIIDGELASGKMKARTSYECLAPAGTPPDQTHCSVEIPVCTVTVEFIGMEVEDVALEHRIGDGDASPVPTPVSGQVPDEEPPSGYGGSCEPTCNHHECAIGGPLDPVCNACADIVCNDGGYDLECCTQGGGGWGDLCITIANQACATTPGTDHCPAA